jgi:hypothetical protein
MTRNLPITAKACTKCKERKDVKDFYLTTTKRSPEKVPHSWCKACTKTRTIIGKRRNAEHLKKFGTKWSKPKAPPVLSKTCRKCSEVKPADQFYVTERDVLHSYCKACIRIQQNKWQKVNESRLKEYRKKWYQDLTARDPQVHSRRKLKAVLKKYGATMEWYERQLEKQVGLCGICGKLEASKGTKKYVGHVRLAIDHCHNSGRVRGLLCMNCNTKLSTLEDIVFRDRAAKYLREFEKDGRGEADSG